MLDRCWLSGTVDGLFWSEDGRTWTRVGAYPFRITSMKRLNGRMVVSVGSGLYEIGATPTDRWLQLHDETLTEVLDFAWVDGDPGVVAASAYGVAFGKRDTMGAVRWDFRSGSRPVNERFANAVLSDGDRLLVGTEGGLLVYTPGPDAWATTNLMGTAVRALTATDGGFLAGADDRGVWRSADGRAWEALGPDGATVYCVASRGDLLLAGTDDGLLRRDGNGPWERVGPDARVGSVSIAGDTWMIGCVPGSVWRSVDAGATWEQGRGCPSHVESLLPPREAA